MDRNKVLETLRGFLSGKARVEGLLIVLAGVIFLLAGPVLEWILCGIAVIYGAKKVVIGS